MPNFTPVYSSWVSDIGYDDETGELHVRHARDGSVTVYANVPPETFDAIVKSPSIGSSLHDLVRGRYEHVTLK